MNALYLSASIIPGVAMWLKLDDADTSFVRSPIAKSVAVQRAAVDEYGRTRLGKPEKARVKIGDKIDTAASIKKLATAYAVFAKRFGQARIDATRTVD